MKAFLEIVIDVEQSDIDAMARYYEPGGHRSTIELAISRHTKFPINIEQDERGRVFIWSRLAEEDVLLAKQACQCWDWDSDQVQPFSFKQKLPVSWVKDSIDCAGL